jgi:signal transduction histidine kinase/ActR/RegA family two-component response regulator
MQHLPFLKNHWPQTQPRSLPAYFLLVAAPLTLIVLTILVVSFQVNRQLYDQRQVLAGREARTSSRQITQLQREHLRLYALIGQSSETIDIEQVMLQRALLESRIKVMYNTLETGQGMQEMQLLYEEYATDWQALQPLLTAWQARPSDAARKTAVLATLTAMERKINRAATAVQLIFEDRMESWTVQSRFITKLLTLGGVSFVIMILLVTAASYLFLRNQTLSARAVSVSERRLNAILAAIPDAVYRVNLSGIYTDYKAPTQPVDYLPHERVIGRTIQETFPVEAATLLQAALRTVAANGEQLLLELTLPHPLDAVDVYYCDARLLPGNQQEVQIIMRDITHNRRREEVAIQTQKLESLGVLAGGIAHDFNNLLTGLLGQASLAAAKVERGLPVTDNIRKITLSAERAADLTRQLLAYTGKGNFESGPLDVNQLIHDTASLMEIALPSHARLILQLEERLPFVEAGRSQLQQVLMNLFMNAIEALGDAGGTIKIKTGVQWVEEDSLDRSTIVNHPGGENALSTGDYVSIVVSDTGMGMDQQTLRRIFDPFFSTKPKGHGLGLSATLGIMRTHKGLLQVHSQPAVGTTFTILLPALPNAVLDEEKPVLSLVAPLHTTPQAVLVIDDEAAVREVATDILATGGFTVVAAASGYEGLDILRTNPHQIGVVLLDLKMPGMNGKETYQNLCQIEPGIKVIFTSGYSEAEVAPLTYGSDRLAFLPKPYKADALIRQIRQMFEQTAAQLN